MSDWWNTGLPSGGQTGGGSPLKQMQTGGIQAQSGKPGGGGMFDGGVQYGGIGQDNRSVAKMLAQLESVMPAAQRRYGAGQGVPFGKGGSKQVQGGSSEPDFSQFSFTPGRSNDWTGGPVGGGALSGSGAGGGQDLDGFMQMMRDSGGIPNNWGAQGGGGGGGGGTLGGLWDRLGGAGRDVVNRGRDVGQGAVDKAREGGWRGTVGGIMQHMGGVGGAAGVAMQPGRLDEANRDAGWRGVAGELMGGFGGPVGAGVGALFDLLGRKKK